MIKNKKNKKKKGFTLVELIAVIAIIGILAAILVPSISGYLTKAKKTKVVEQARQYVMAFEATRAEGKAKAADEGTKVSALSTSTSPGQEINEIVDLTNKLDLIQAMDFTTASSIVNENADFEINEDGEFTGLTTTP